MFRDSGIKMIAIEYGKIIVSMGIQIITQLQESCSSLLLQAKVFWESNGGKM